MVPRPGLQCVIVAHFSVSLPHDAMAWSAEFNCSAFPGHAFFIKKYGLAYSYFFLVTTVYQRIPDIAISEARVCYYVKYHCQFFYLYFSGFVHFGSLIYPGQCMYIGECL